MIRIHWEEVSIIERRAVYAAYMAMSDDGTDKATFEECNARWTGCEFIMIKYTFCPVGYWG